MEELASGQSRNVEPACPEVEWEVIIMMVIKIHSNIPLLSLQLGVVGRRDNEKTSFSELLSGCFTL